jgi:hypothetical protein
MDIRTGKSRMVRRGVWLVLAAGAVAVLSGCAADRDARELASRLRKLTAEYDSLSSAKAAAERQFYLDSLKNLDQTLNVVDLGSPTPAASVEKTLAYGRIVTRANYDSQRLAETLSSSGEPLFVAGAISEFIRDGIRADEQAYLQTRQMQAAIAESLAIDFAKLAEYQKRIAEVSRGLAELERPPDSAARTRKLRALGEAVWQQLRSDKDAVK